MMLKRSTYGTPALGIFRSQCCVGGRGALLRSLRRKQGWSTHPVQILVVVANIQSRTLKTEVEKVFGRTVFGPESVGPNPRGKPPCKAEGAHGWQQPLGFFRVGKGKSVQHSDTTMRGSEVATQMTILQPCRAGPERVLFSL